MQEHNPHKTAQSRRSLSRILLIGFAALLVLLAGMYFISVFLLNSYLHSEAFRVFLNRKTSDFFLADGEYMPVQCSGMSFYSDGYQAHGLAGSSFSDLRAEQIRAEFSPMGLFNRAWQINDIQIQRLKAGFGRITPGAAAVFVAAPPPQAAEPERGSWIPNRLEIRRVQIQQTALAWSFPNGNGGVQEMRMLLEPAGTALRVGGFGGRVVQDGFPPLKIDHLKVRCQLPDIFITDALFKLGDSGNIVLSGQMSMGHGGAMDLHPSFNGISITPFVPDDWRASLHGLATGLATVQGRVDDPGSIQVTGKLSMTGGQLEALPILDKIASFTRTEQFRRIALQKASADFSWIASKCSVSNLVMESKGLLRLEGGCVVERGSIDGLFMVGVAPGCLRWLPGSQERVFTQERAGFVWTPVRISGPLTAMREDLTPRLVRAAGDQMTEEVRGTVEKGVQGVFDLLNPLVP